MKTQVREVRYQLLEYLRVQAYYVRREGGRPHGRRARNNPTTEVQEALNAKNAARKLTDIIHLNFTPEDIALHPTYVDGKMPATADEANRLMKNYISRLKYRYKKINGTTDGFKWLYTTEVASTGRIHHHMIVSCHGIDFTELIDAWGHGRCSPRLLEFDEDGVVGLTHYIIKDPITMRRWYCSTGLLRPSPRVSDTHWSQKRFKKLCCETPDLTAAAELYPGWTVSRVEKIDTTGGTFIELFLYRTDNNYFAYDRFGRRRRRKI